VAKYLSDIGSSADLRALVATTDVSPTTIPLLLDKPRTVKVIAKTATRDELVVRCKDDNATIILHLPFESGSRGHATVIIPKDERS
jgi:hypothetical protein